MFRDVCKHLKHIEKVNPLPCHQSYLGEWKTHQEESCDLLENAVDIVDCALTLREELFKASFDLENERNLSPITDWEWLLTVEQMAQRTEEWYLQKARLLTASEISAVWKTVKARNALILSKAFPPTASIPKRLATLKNSTSPMDWGVRYEPVVKYILETRHACKIAELGRIYHRTIPGLAASPDGLITEGPAHLVGSLVEIKCPTTRVIIKEIPYDYWCQMQIQMEVCGIPRCEYVEVKIKEGDAIDATTDIKLIKADGWITLDLNKDTDDMRYQYHQGTPEQDPAWISIETYPWNLDEIRRTTVYRDTAWFNKVSGDITKFWKDVEDVKNGVKVIDTPKKRVKVDPTEYIPDVPMFQLED